MKKFTINISTAAKQTMTSSTKAAEEQQRVEAERVLKQQQEQLERQRAEMFQAQQDHSTSLSNHAIKRQKVADYADSEDVPDGASADIAIDDEKNQTTMTQAQKGDQTDDSDDDWGPMPLLPLPKPQSSKTPSSRSQIEQPRSDPQNNPKKRPFVEWDDDDDYSDDSQPLLPTSPPRPSNTLNPPLHPINSALASKATQYISKLTQIPNLFSFTTGISYPLADSTNITSIITSPVDHFDKQVETLTSSAYSTIIFDPALFSNLIIHTGASNGQLVSIDFSRQIHPTVTLSSKPEKLIAVNKLLPISHYNPNPDLFTYDRKSGVQQFKLPINFLAVGNCSQIFALGRGHEIVATSKAGYALRLADKEPGHIAPIRDISFAPAITPQVQSAMQQLQRHFSSHVVNSDDLTVNTETWKQSYSGMQLGRDHVWTGGDDGLVRLWSIDTPKGERLEGHMQYFIEKRSIEVYKLNTSLLTSPITGPIGVQIYPHQQLSHQDRAAVLMKGGNEAALHAQYLKPSMTLFYDFHPSTKLKITTICPISQKYVLVGTKGGLIFSLDVSRNAKESIWVMTPPQYLPIPPLQTPPKDDDYTTTECTIAFNEFIEIKHISVISPTQAFVVVSGDFSLGFIINLDNFDKRPNSRYFNTYTVFYYPELEITSILPTYSYNLPTQYNSSKFNTNGAQSWTYPISHDEQGKIVQTPRDLLFPNYDGLLCGFIISAIISKEIKTQYNNVRRGYLEKVEERRLGEAKVQQQQQQQLERLEQDEGRNERQSGPTSTDQNRSQTQVKEELGVSTATAPTQQVLIKEELTEHGVVVTSEEARSSASTPTAQIKSESLSDAFTPLSSFVQAMKEGQERLRDGQDEVDLPAQPLKVYTMEELDELAEYDKHAAEEAESQRATPQLWELKQYNIHPAKRHHMQQHIASRPGFDEPSPLPFSKQHVMRKDSWFSEYHHSAAQFHPHFNTQPPDQSILESLIRSMISTFQDDAQTTAQNDTGDDIKGNDQTDFSEDSSFIISISLNLPSVTPLSARFRQPSLTQSNSTHQNQNQNQNQNQSSDLDSLFNSTTVPISLPTIETVSHLPHQQVYSLTWYKQMLLAGCQSSILLLPNLNLLTLISAQKYFQSNPSSLVQFNPKSIEQQFTQRLLAQLMNIYLAGLQLETSHQVQDKPPPRKRGGNKPTHAGPQAPSKKA